jgi:DNA-directed RNA polymerase specialized sigma24 family protein
MRKALFEHAYQSSRRAAQVRSAAAVARGAITAADREDVEQELLICVWQALTKYDPARAELRTFIELVVRTQLTSMLRLRRRRFEFEPLDEGSTAGEGGFREIELRTDARRSLADVSMFDRVVARSLTECSAIETSREMCVSRSAVYRAMGRLRVAFTAAGFAGGPRYAAPRPHHRVQQPEPAAGITENCTLGSRVRA